MATIITSDKWEYASLGDFVEITTGKKDVNEGNPKGKYPFFTCAKEYTFADTYSFDDEVILISGNGAGVGYCHYYKGKFEAYQRTYVIRHFNGVDVNFLLQYLLYALRREILSQKQDSATPYIKLGLLKNFQIPKLKNTEQIKIAKVLSTWDTAIERAGQLLNTKTRRFSWLIKTLTIPSSNARGWKEIELGEVGDISKGKGITKEDLMETGTPCIRYADLYTQYDFVIREIKAFVSQRAASLSCPLQKGDILFAGSGETAEDIGKCAVYLGNYPHAVVGGDTLILRSSGVDPNYLTYALNSPAANKQKSILGHGFSVVHLYGKDLKSVRLWLPPDDQQKQIAKTLNAAKREIDLLKQLSVEYSKQKRGLMQRLLTGKVRVRV